MVEDELIYKHMCSEGLHQSTIIPRGSLFGLGPYTVHGVFEFAKIDDTVVILIVFIHQGIDQLFVAAEVLAIGLEYQLKLFPLYLAVPVKVERVESKPHIVIAGHNSFIDAHCYELVIVDLSVSISIDR